MIVLHRLLRTLLLLTILSPAVLGHVLAELGFLGELRITFSDAPAQVPQGYDFSFSFHVRYATREPTKVYPAIFEGREGELRRIIWRGPEQELRDGGTKSYKATVRSPLADIVWRVTVYMFFFEDGAWRYAKDERGPGFRELQITVSNTAKVRVYTGLPGLEVSVDGSRFLANGNGTVDVQLPIFTLHTVEVPKEFSQAPGTRSLLLKWSDGITEARRRLNVTGPTNLVANYKTQYSLSVNSEFGQAFGQGWYDAGSIVEFGVPASVPFDGLLGFLGAAHIFQEWTGDSSARSATARTVMDRPRSVRAIWSDDSRPAIFNAIAILLGILAALLGLKVLSSRRRIAREMPHESKGKEPLGGVESQANNRIS